MSKRGKKKKGKDQPAVKKLPVSEPLPLPPNFPGGLKLELLTLSLIIVAFVLLCWNSLKQESVTVDELAHLPAGLSFLRTGDFRLYRQSPPLLRMFAALPLLRGEVKLPFQKSWEKGLHFDMGYDFMYANAKSYQSIYLRGRAMILLLGIGLVALTWWWARSLYGPKSGIVAAALTAFCPNIMAHSGLVTTDIGASLFFLAATYSFWEFCRRPSLLRCAIAGLVLGLALLCKFTCLILLPIIIGLGILYHFFCPRDLDWQDLIWGVLLMFLISLLILNTGYLWQGFGTPVDQYAFQSRLMIGLSKNFPAKMPIPLPYDFVSGLDMQTFENESTYPVYFLGKISRQGWRYYYLVTMVFKMTLSSLGLILAGLASLKFGKKSWQDEIFILIPPIAILAGLSLFTDIDLGFRYILPAVPYLYIIASRLSSSFLSPRPWQRVLIWMALSLHIISNLLVYPHYLAYFNIAAGGPEKGYKILADSNIDWGQDLIRLKKYMDAEKLDDICLAYFGRVDPEIYGIRYHLPYRGEDCRLLAISVNFLVGLPYLANDHGKILEVKAEDFSSLRARKPLARVGYSILVFDLSRAP